jgi:hypothetical protein
VPELPVPPTDVAFNVYPQIHIATGIKERSAIGGDSAFALPERRRDADRDVSTREQSHLAKPVEDRRQHICANNSNPKKELKKMGNHSMPSKPSVVTRTVAAGAIAGCTAVGFGALSSVAAPTANAKGFGGLFGGGGSTSSTSNTTTNKNSPTISISQGNTTQSNSRSGNIVNPQFGIGVLGPTQASTTVSVGNVSALNGVANVTTIAITTVKTTTTTTTTTTTNTGVNPVVP